MRPPRTWTLSAVVVGFVAVVVVGWVGATSTTHTMGRSLLALHVVVGFTLVVAAALLAAMRVRAGWVLLLVPLSLTVLAEVLRSWPRTPPGARTALMVLGTAGPAFVILLAASVAGRGERLERAGPGLTPALARAGLVVAGAIGALVVALALVRVPLLDRTCRFDCGLPTWVPFPDPDIASTLSEWQAAVVAVAAAVAVALLVCTVLDSRRELRIAWPGLVVISAAVTALVVEAVGHHLVLDDGASLPDTRSVLANGLLALAVVASAVPGARRALAVRELARGIGHEAVPGELRDRLASVLGDPSLVVGFWIPEVGGFVDRDGVRISPDRTATRVRLSRRGRPVALVVTRRTADDVRSGLSSIGASARLAIENERQFAELAFRARQIDATRREIVERSTSERLAIERGLHDGAQAGLVAALFELARLRAASADSPEARRLEVALTHAHARLRELAHGVYPALLDGVGLVEALRELGTSRPLVVNGDPSRLRTDVEHGLYRLVRAVGDDGSHLRVEVEVAGDDAATVTVSGLRSAAPAVVVDAITVLGGSVDCDGQVLTAVVRCAR